MRKAAEPARGGTPANGLHFYVVLVTSSPELYTDAMMGEAKTSQLGFLDTQMVVDSFQ